jgi:hypothetical protein
MTDARGGDKSEGGRKWVVGKLLLLHVLPPLIPVRKSHLTARMYAV